MIKKISLILATISLLNLSPVTSIGHNINLEKGVQADVIDGYTSNNEYEDRFIEYTTKEIDKQVDKAMIYEDMAYARIYSKSTSFQYIAIGENNLTTLIPEINSKIMRIFDDKNGILAEGDDFYAAHMLKYDKNEVLYKYDVKKKKVDKIVPDVEGYKEFNEVLKKNGYGSATLESSTRELNPTWISFSTSKSGLGNLNAFYNRKTKQIMAYKDHGNDKIEIIDAIGEKAYFTYKYDNLDLDNSNDINCVVSIENGKFKVLGNIKPGLEINDISEDEKFILVENDDIYVLKKGINMYEYLGSEGSICGDDIWVEGKSNNKNYFRYYDKDTEKLETVYNDSGINKIVSKGKFNVFGYWESSITESRGKYFKHTYTELSRPVINNVELSDETFYTDYPYKITVDSTKDALVNIAVKKNGNSTETGYRNKNDLVTLTGDRNEITVYVKNKDSKYNYDNKYTIPEFKATHTYYPIYDLDINNSKITGRSKEPVKIVHEKRNSVIEEIIADVDEVGRFDVNFIYPLKAGDYVGISYISSGMKTGKAISGELESNISINPITTADTNISLTSEVRFSGRAVAKVNNKIIGETNFTTKTFNINIEKPLKENDLVEVVVYDSKNVEYDKQTLNVFKDEFPTIITDSEEKSILINEVNKFNPLSLVKANDRENGNITSKIKVIENTVKEKVGEYKVKYLVSDYKGQVTTKEIKIIVRSNEIPKIIGVTNKTIKVGENFNKMIGITAFDEEDGDITSKIVVNGEVNINKAGTYKLIYSVVDSDLNYQEMLRTITVRSNEKPILNNLKDKQIFIGEKFDKLLGVTATDVEDGDLTSKINVSGDVDTNKVGVYTLTYTVTDSDNNKTSKSIKITVKVNEKPILNNLEDKQIIIGDKFDKLAGITATDAEDGDLTAKIKVSGDVDTTKEGIYELTYTVTDSYKNTTSKTIKVTVRSNKNPVIKASNRTIKLFDEFDPMKGVSAEDKEDGNLTSAIKIVENTVNTSKVGVYTVKYEVIDSDNNKTIEQISVTVESDSNSDWKSNWANKEIKHAMDSGWVQTTETFRPEDSITRAEFVKIVNKAFGFKTKASSENFTDVDSKQWWYSEVLIALKAGYINGKNATFRPNDKITREEVAAIVTSIKDNKDTNLDKIKKYKDFDKVSDWAQTSVEGAIEAGYMGVNSDMFNPKQNITRAQSVVTLYRIVK